VKGSAGRAPALHAGGQPGVAHDFDPA